MRKYSEQPFINTDIAALALGSKQGSDFPAEQHLDATNPLPSKYKQSSPTIFGDPCRLATPIQWQLSPIELSRREREPSGFSENFDFSVKSHHDYTRQSTPAESEHVRLQQLVLRERIFVEEQETLNRKVRQIREEANQRIQLLENQYVQQRLQVLRQVENQLRQKNSEPPLKSALKKKDTTRQHTSEKETLYYPEEDSQGDWNFIQQAKQNLHKQKTQQNFFQEESKQKTVGEDKVRFVNTKEYHQQKKFKKQCDINNFLKCRY